MNETTDGINLAHGKPTKMSSTLGEFVSWRAVDGDRDSMSFGHSCTQTRKEKDAWWQVDLQAVYNIREVVITNRGDCCGELECATDTCGTILAHYICIVNGSKLVNVPFLSRRYWRCSN